jgi:hypothetical protein
MKRRVGLTQLMALIAVLALGLALMKVAPEESDRWAGALFLVTLLVATLALIVRRDRAGWVGFTLFGWAYALVALIAPLQTLIQDRLPTDEMIDRWVIDHVHSLPPAPINPLNYQMLVDASGYWKSNSNSGWVRFQPTPEEAKIIDVYLIQVQQYREHERKIPRSRQIFYTFSGFAFALVGSIAGRVLSDRAILAGGISDLQPSPQVG